jgi:ketosteroid isomerase-like protein
MSIMRITLVVFAFFLLFSCDLSFRKHDARIKALNAMQQTDVDFAQMAEEKGFRKAFMEYMEEEAILLRDNHMPIIGADAVQYISSINDSTFKISWEPQGGDVAESGDMGYTFGLYQLKTETEEQRGTYLTIWRKQKDGKWKYAVDAGTQGLEPPGENKE